MNTVAVGFWGAFFGSIAMMLAGSLLAYVRSMHKVALRAALTALLSALFVMSYLGWLPIDDRELEERLLAHTFGSRIAWFDRDKREIAELPLADAR